MLQILINIFSESFDSLVFYCGEGAGMFSLLLTEIYTSG